MPVRKRRADHRQIEIAGEYSGHTCSTCPAPKHCASGRCPCEITGEFLAGPLRGKLACEVGGPPVPIIGAV